MTERARSAFQNENDSRGGGKSCSVIQGPEETGGTLLPSLQGEEAHSGAFQQLGVAAFGDTGETCPCGLIGRLGV